MAACWRASYGHAPDFMEAREGEPSEADVRLVLLGAHEQMRSTMLGPEQA